MEMGNLHRLGCDGEVEGHMEQQHQHIKGRERESYLIGQQQDDNVESLHCWIDETS